MRLSTNSATGVSLNVSPELTCAARCPYCYATGRTKAEAARLCTSLGLEPGLISANNGPITWEIQQACYRRQTLELQSMTIEGIRAEAQRLAKSLDRRGYDNIRVPGCGDLFKELTTLCFYLAAEEIQVYGFSRKPEEILRLEALLRAGGMPKPHPHFLLSIDRWTPADEIRRRADAGMVLAGKSVATLAYMALADEKADDIRSNWWWPLCAVVLGYHATMVHTRVHIARECGKTAGLDTDCQTCKRCIRGA